MGGDSGSSGDTGSASGWTTIERTPSLVGLPSLSSPIDGVSVLDSGFGPRRISAEDYRTDFHPGVDLDAAEGTSVLALTDGVVRRVDSDDNTVTIEHTFEQAVSFHGHELEVWYSRSNHLGEVWVTEDQAVEAGQGIGTVGSKGGAKEPHLHLEARLGTWCSLRYSTENPDSSCAREYDPAINPLHLLPRDVDELFEVELLTGNPLSIRVTTREGDFDLNRVLTPEHTLDFDLREGIDPTTEEHFDDLDYGWLKVDPARDSAEELHQSWTLVFEGQPEWVEILDIQGQGWRLDP